MLHTIVGCEKLIKKRNVLYNVCVTDKQTGVTYRVDLILKQTMPNNTVSICFNNNC